jgi:hypothetical protein
MPRLQMTAGRIATFIVLSVLVLTVSAALYVFLAQQLGGSAGAPGIATDDEAAQAAAETRRLITLLTVLLISALLILLFVLGAYLVIRLGQYVARDKVGGKPTEYVDAWRQYRLSDDDISAATAEDGEGPPPPK